MERSSNSDSSVVLACSSRVGVSEQHAFELIVNITSDTQKTELQGVPRSARDGHRAQGACANYCHVTMGNSLTSLHRSTAHIARPRPRTAPINTLVIS